MVQKNHPMWLFIFILFGLSLSLFFNMIFELIFVPKSFSLIILVLSLVFGTIIMFREIQTPSKTIRFEKNMFETILTWILVILSVILLFAYYIFDTFIFLV